MTGESRPQYGRQLRLGPRDGSGQGRGRGACRAGREESSLGGRTTTRALIAVGAYVVQDLRDPYGVTRPLLRRAALRMVASRQMAVRRLGGAYLHGDPPTAKEVTGGQPARGLLEAPASESDHGTGKPPSLPASGAPATAV